MTGAVPRPGETAAVEAVRIAMERILRGSIYTDEASEVVAAAYPIIAEAVRADERKASIALVSGMEVDGNLLNSLKDALHAADGEAQMSDDVLSWGELAEVAVAVVTAHLLNGIAAARLARDPAAAQEETR